MILEYWRDIVGNAVNYFTVGTGNNIQWHYGNLLEYSFVSIAVLLVIILTFKLLFSFIRLFYK